MYNWALAKRLARMLRTDLFDEYGYVQERPVDRRKIDCYTMEPSIEYDDRTELPQIVLPTLTGQFRTPKVYRVGSDIWVMHVWDRDYSEPGLSLEWVYCFSYRQNRWKLIRRGTMAHRIREYERLAALL